VTLRRRRFRHQPSPPRSTLERSQNKVGSPSESDEISHGSYGEVEHDVAAYGRKRESKVKGRAGKETGGEPE